MDSKYTELRMNQATDEALVTRMQEGDTHAFELLYDRHVRRALRVARAVVGDRELAEEAVQEAFLSIWRNAGRYDPRVGSFRAWALSVVRYRAIDTLRVRRKESGDASVDDEFIAVPDERADTEAAVAQRLETVRIRRQLAQLPLPQRELVVLAFFGGVSHSELAAQLSLPLGTVKGRMRLALAKLRNADAGEVPEPLAAAT
jgi:RNA polymerase sigma-70 factor, ECF subfamily